MTQISKAQRDEEYKQLWKPIVDFIANKYPQFGQPITWDRPKVRHFAQEMRRENKARLMSDGDLARSFNLDPTAEKRVYKWAGVSEDTFINIFQKEKYHTKSVTLDKFALYVGFRSGEDYKQSQSSTSQKPAENTTEVTSRAVDEEEPAHIKSGTDQPMGESTRQANPADHSRSNVKRGALFFALAAIIIGAYIVLPLKQNEGKPNRVATFLTNRPLKVLVLPFSVPESKGATMSDSFKEQLEWNIPTDAATQSLLEIRVLDTLTTRYSPLDMRSIGKAHEANLVLWGSYSQLSNDAEELKLYHLFIDSTYADVAEICSSSSALSHDADDISVGLISGEVDQAINTCLAFIAASQGDWERCLSYLNRNDSVMAKGIVELRMLGYASYVVHQDYETAYQALSKACALEDHRWSYSNLGVFARLTGRYEEAQRALEHAIAVDPSYARAIVNLGNVHMMQEHYEDAIACYDRSLAIDPRDSISNVNRGEAYMELGLYDEAMRDFVYYRSKAPEDPYIHHYLGKLHIAMGDISEAKKCLALAHKLDPNDQEVVILLESLDRG